MISKSSRYGVGSLIVSKGSPRASKPVSGDLRLFCNSPKTHPGLSSLTLTIVPQATRKWGPDFFEAFRNGEEQAFDQLFRAYHGPLTYYAFKFLQDEQGAEDIVQDCFVQLWERRHKLTEVQAIAGYLYRCVYNQCCTWLQKQRRTASATELPPQTEEPAFLVESGILQQILQVIDQLPSRLKEVIRLHYLEEKPLEEIAQYLGIAPETARKHRYRAIQLIRKTLSAAGGCVMLVFGDSCIC